jgi:hypothetical protein
MSRLIHLRAYAVVVICFCLYTCLTASATSVTVTGSGALGNAAIDHLSVTAGIFSASSVVPSGRRRDGPSSSQP